MLKFHTNDTTLLATFEDFITTVFVMIDDLYRRYAPPEVAKRRHALDAKLSDSEIITVSLCGELAGIDSENAWYSFVKRNYQHLFPNLCSRSRFNRTRRALLQTTELLRQKLSSVLRLRLADSASWTASPLPSASLGGPVAAIHSAALGQTMGNVRPKKRRILAIKSMPWSPWRDMSRHSKSHQPPQMTGKGCVTWWMDNRVLSSLGTKAIRAEPWPMTCQDREYTLWR